MAEITLEQLDAREADLLQQFEQVKANGNAIQGALQDCAYWRGVLTKQADADTEPSPVGEASA